VLVALPQGEMGILIAGYLLSRGLASPLSFNVALAAVVLLTLAVPTLIKILAAKRKHDIPYSYPVDSTQVTEER